MATLLLVRRVTRVSRSSIGLRLSRNRLVRARIYFSAKPTSVQRATLDRTGRGFCISNGLDFRKHVNMNVISATEFYGNETIAKQKLQGRKEIEAARWVKESRKMPSYILGPSEFWMEFDKQATALDTAVKESNDSDVLCTFVYQRENGYRKFVVAQPERYWWHYEHREAEKRCSYEVIPEHHPCRLYLDLEYSTELNADSDGPSMTSTIIDIFCAYLLARWGLPCNRGNVLNLESSTREKFSRHLIFNVKHVAFKDNYHVGRLVKSVCNDIVDYLRSKQKQTRYDVLSCFDRAKLEGLLVQTKKGKTLFIDTAVYTRNRHFRIYKSTKWGKQSNLIMSDDCKYIPSNVGNDKELNIFLDSLISYLPSKKDLILLECPESGTAEVKCLTEDARHYRESSDASSRYPILDRHISNVISPGKIRTCKYFESAKVLVYETTGYRYCENIDRCHKSNNVFWIVDLKRKTMYQKCHDEDCHGFKSTPKRLPEEISFQIDEEYDALLSCAIATEDMVQQDVGPLS